MVVRRRKTKIYILITLMILIIVSLSISLGLRAYCVAGHSMEPAVPLGSLVFAVSTEEPKQNLKKDDVIIFSSSKTTMPVMHRICSIEEDGAVTKGDNSNAVDGRIPWIRIKSKVIFHIPAAGYPILLIHNFLQ